MTAAGTAESSRPASPRIALFGPYASRNLGDTATQMTVIANLRRRVPGAQFIGVSPEPADTLRSLGIPAFPLSGAGETAGDAETRTERQPDSSGSKPHFLRTAKRISAFVASLDLLVVSGGGQLDDFWGGPWGHPWSMLLWTLLARRHGVPVAYLAVGIDKLDATLSGRFCRWALDLASWRTFRDPVSRQTMVNLGLAGPSTVIPDVVFGLIHQPSDERSGQAPFVVFSPISRKTWSHDESAAHRQYMDALTDCALHFAAQGLEIRIVCSQTVMDRDDARQLEQRLLERGVTAVAWRDAPTVADFLRLVEGAELVVASRLHAVILSLIAGAPVVAVAHLAKVDAAMQAVGLQAYCLPLHDVRADELRTLAARAYDGRRALASQVERARERLARELNAAFDALALLIAR